MGEVINFDILLVGAGRPLDKADGVGEVASKYIPVIIDDVNSYALLGSWAAGTVAVTTEILLPGVRPCGCCE